MRHLLILLLSLPLAAAEPLQLGMNVTGISYWSGDAPFVDIMKQAGEAAVVSGSAEQRLAEEPDPHLTADASGWPVPLGQDWQGPAIRFLLPGGNEAVADPEADGHRELPTGVWTLVVRGAGRLRLEGGGFAATEVELDGAERQIPVLRQAGQVAKPCWARLEILSSRLADPVRGVRLLMPGITVAQAEEHPFPRAFLDNLRPFPAGLRLMDWCAVNNAVATTWDQRPRPERYGWSPLANRAAGDAGLAGKSSTGSVPYEIMCRLAIELDRPLWICIPPQADDDYVRRLAELFRDRYPQHLPLTVEYANEMFNRAFRVYGHAEVQARSAFPAMSTEAGRWHWLARRQAEVYAIFAQAWGLDPLTRDRRLRFCLPAEAVDAWLAEGLERRVAIDQVICNYYYGIPFPKQMIAMGWLSESDDQLMRRLLAMIPDDLSGHLAKPVAAVQRLRERQAVDLVAYEGGSHFHGIWWNKEIQEQTGDITRRLKRRPEIYDAGLAAFRAVAGAGMVRAYAYASVGDAFGHRWHPTQPDATAHQQRACLDWIAGSR